MCVVCVVFVVCVISNMCALHVFLIGFLCTLMYSYPWCTWNVGYGQMNPLYFVIILSVDIKTQGFTFSEEKLQLYHVY